ncbi:FliC/FljB family flagellin [Aidingimonas halophila]|uniref:Flagellin n=1 Tax=Aidingimonas halophila TaxID=574349 RepID=A0A1H3D785_9GAMM|nr:FliC/FljB family flagellin [Aidingimonas halophila]GHC30434.1 flagellin [Aidingimonas halophila]SDX62160.1 flagellin [Aidingimonas halophila]
MSVINTNITAQIAQQNLSNSSDVQTTAMERLSSGLRINSAADDAAGQAIANRMSSQITGLGQAQRNANDGISVAQTTEGALNQVNDNLQRVRELTVQAENGTNSEEDLQSIQDEIGQRLSEIDRISEETDFNGVKVLSEGDSLEIQVGANDGESISINLEEISAETLGLTDFNVDGPRDVEAADTATVDEFLSDEDVSDVGTVTAMDGTDFGLASASAAASEETIYSDANGDLYAKVSFDGSEMTSDEIEDLQAQGIDIDSDSTDVTAYMSLNPDEATVNGSGTANFDSLSNTDDLSRLSVEPTEDPLETLDSALSQVDSLRSELGAVQNRFDSAINNLATNETNLSDARSRIEDADYATEVSEMTRGQILQQAGTSVLAQANQIPQNALSLLG